MMYVRARVRIKIIIICNTNYALRCVIINRRTRRRNCSTSYNIRAQYFIQTGAVSTRLHTLFLLLYCSRNVFFLSLRDPVVVLVIFLCRALVPPIHFRQSAARIQYVLCYYFNVVVIIIIIIVVVVYPFY